jgi:hypothetical protein
MRINFGIYLRVIEKYILNIDRKIVSGYLITLVSLFILRKCHIQILNHDPTSLILILILCTSLFLIIKNKPDSFVLGVLGGTATFALLLFLYETYKIIFQVNEWDFLCFYLFGKVGASGLNFYDPVNFANVFSGLVIPFKVGQSFILEIIQVGFWYPPPTMMIFIPLGYLNNIVTAKIVWEIFVLTFLVLDIILLERIIKSNDNKWINIFIVLGITLALPATNGTLASSQTNFLLLFFLLLVYKNPEDWKSGIYLALAVLIKPIAAVWFLYYIINKKWIPLVSFILTGFVIVVISALWFGPNSYVTFFTSPPTSRMPAFVFTESVNQSLLATISRLSIKTGIKSFLVNKGILVAVVSTILTITTCVASSYMAKSNQRFSFLIFIPLSLLIYPSSPSHYAVILLPIIFEIVRLRIYLGPLLITSFIILIFISSFFTSLSLLCLVFLYSFSKTSYFKLIHKLNLDIGEFFHKKF